MLEITLNTKFVPGTNLRGGLAVADWRYLLPSLRFDHVLCIGAPSVNDLSVYGTLGQKIFVVSNKKIKLLKLSQEIQIQKIQNLQLICVDSLDKLPFADNSLDLIFKYDEKTETQDFKEKNTFAELNRILSMHGVIYFETNSIKDLGARFKAAQVFWLMPFTGKMRTAQPVWDEKIATYFFSNVMYGQSIKKRALSQIGKHLSKIGWLKYLTPRRAVLLRQAPVNGGIAQPPMYLKSLAEKSGFDLNGYRFGLSTRGLGNSNKAIFYLFERTASLPEIVIKMTRGPEFNYRLENENRVLKLLKEKQIVSQETFPEALFFDYHNHLAILGQRAVDGEPFRARTAANESCPVFHDAVNWLVQLGAAEGSKSAAVPGEVAIALSKLYKRFIAIYKLSNEHQMFLYQKIHAITDSKQVFPLVFQHGDPGTWNILVSKAGKVIFMDWEAGEPQGMPLWDLFYFFRTYGSWVSRQQGSRDALKNFTQHFLQPSALSTLLQEIVSKYCNLIGLDHELIESLFYTCWMHRALKESTRLTGEKLDSGHYVNLLRLAIDNRSSLAFT